LVQVTGGSLPGLRGPGDTDAKGGA